MRNGLERNKQTFYYATGTALKDAYGNTTGNTWSNPVLAKANIAAASGEAQRRAFGITELYDRVINPLPNGFPLSANMRLWIDTMPTLAGDGSTTTPHDYEPRLPGNGLSHNFLVVKKVSVG